MLGAMSAAKDVAGRLDPMPDDLAAAMRARGRHRLDRAFEAVEVTSGGRTMTFDSFECAIHAMAPACAHCGCKIVGHGVEAGGRMYCCAHCAQHQGGLRDRAA